MEAGRKICIANRNEEIQKLISPPNCQRRMWSKEQGMWQVFVHSLIYCILVWRDEEGFTDRQGDRVKDRELGHSIWSKNLFR